MRVGVRVAVSREVLGCCEHSDILKALGVGAPQDPSQFGAASERPTADDGVGRVAVDIHHWSEVDVHAHGLQ